MKRGALGTVVACAAFAMGACVGAGVAQLSADTYRLSRVDGGGRYADTAAMKAAVIADANAFARSRGKIAVPVATHEETMRAGHLSTIDYDFRLVAPGEAATATAAAVAAAPAAPVVPVVPAVPPVQPAPAAVAQGERSAAVPAPVGQAAAAAATPPAAGGEAKPDLYTELIKLDELRRRGILTDAEFQALKTKLIAGR